MTDWIAVSDGLPDITLYMAGVGVTDPLLICIQGADEEPVVDIGFYGFSDDIDPDLYEWYEIRGVFPVNVTHWAERPPPPGQEGDDG